MTEPESLCTDCGVDTAPCTGHRGCRHAGRWEDYMVTDAIWIAAGMPFVAVTEYHGQTGYLCVRCLERRLRRPLRAADFSSAPINDPDPWDTPLLAARKAAA